MKTTVVGHFLPSVHLCGRGSFGPGDFESLIAFYGLTFVRNLSFERVCHEVNSFLLLQMILAKLLTLVSPLLILE